jgi:hypothetical protein
VRLAKDGPEFDQAFADMFGEPEPFRPTATYIADGDCIEFFIRPDPFLGRRIDDLVTVYVSQETGEIIGSLVKDVSRFCRDIVSKLPGFRIAIDDGHVRLEHLFLAKVMSETPEQVHELTYRKLIEAAHDLETKVEVCGAV